MYLIDIEKGYLAGIIDGEGSISIQQRLYGKYLNIQGTMLIRMTDKATIEYIIKIIGSLPYGYCERENKRNLKCKRSYDLEFGLKSAVILLRKILPYMITKKRQAELIIELYECKRKNKKNLARQYELLRECEYLNMRGK